MKRLSSIFAILLLLSLQTAAQLQISQRVSPTNDYESALSVGPAAQGILTSADASSTKLLGVDVWSSVPYRAFIYRVQNGAQDTNPSAVGGAPGLQTFQWRSPDPIFITLGAAAAALNAYRVIVVNLDQANTSDCYVVFHYGG
jgi:hypothetical protein